MPPLRSGWTRPPSRSNSVITIGVRPPRPHLTHLTLNLFHSSHLGGALDLYSASLLPIQSHPLPPTGHPLIFPPLHPPLSHLSSIPRRRAHSSSQLVSFSTFSVSLSGRGLSLTQAPSKTHAQSVAIWYTQVGPPFFPWCVSNGATAAAPGFTLQLTTGGCWRRGAAPHAPPKSHLLRPIVSRSPPT